MALDGSKLRANASRERNCTAAQLEAEVERMLAEAEQADAEEQADSGRHQRDALPPELRSRTQRLTRLREAQELQPMVETTNRNLEALGPAPIGTLLADAGYYSDANVRLLAEAGPELLIASRNDRNRRAAGPAGASRTNSRPASGCAAR